MAENNIADATAKIDEISARISELAASVNLLVVGDVKDMMNKAQEESDRILAEMTELEIAIADGRTKLYDDRYRLTTVQAEYDALREAARMQGLTPRRTGSREASSTASWQYTLWRIHRI